MPEKSKKKKAKVSEGVKRVVEISYTPGFQDVRTETELQERVAEFVEIEAAVAPLLAHLTEMKKCITDYGVRKKRTVIQMPDYYWRLITRSTKMWVFNKTDMPKPKPKGAKSIREICGDKTVKVNGSKKKLWPLLTKRVVDPEAIERAINKGWITEDEIDKAYIESPQKPFYQKYEGEASS